jgi:hypothetical protein
MGWCLAKLRESALAGAGKFQRARLLMAPAAHFRMNGDWRVTVWMRPIVSFRESTSLPMHISCTDPIECIFVDTAAIAHDFTPVKDLTLLPGSHEVF